MKLKVYRANSGLVVLLLAGCVSGPTLRSSPAESTASTQQTNSNRDSVRAGIYATASDFAPAKLDINTRCVEAGARASLPYASGDCDSSGKVTGFASAKLENLLVEGMFDTGNFVTGTKYRVVFVRKDSDGRGDGSGFSCTDMRPADYGIVKRSGNKNISRELEFISTSSTVCKDIFEGRGTGALRNLTRTITPLGEGAIKYSYREFILMGKVKQKASYELDTDRDQTPKQKVEIEGIAAPLSSLSKLNQLPERYHESGTLRRIFRKDGYLEKWDGKGTILCLEGGAPDACVRFDGCTRPYQRHGVSDIPGTRAGCGLPGRPITLDGGIVFTPKTNASMTVYVRGARIDPQFRSELSVKSFNLGDSLQVVPGEGHIKYPDGKQYTGVFVRGEPL